MELKSEMVARKANGSSTSDAELHLKKDRATGGILSTAAFAMIKLSDQIATAATAMAIAL